MGVLLQWELFSIWLPYQLPAGFLCRLHLESVLCEYQQCKVPHPLLHFVTKTIQRCKKTSLMQSTHECWSDSLYLLLSGHVSSINSKDIANWFHILCHRTLAKQQLYLVNHSCLQTNQRTWNQSLQYHLLRDLVCPPCPHLTLVSRRSLGMPKPIVENISKDTVSVSTSQKSMHACTPHTVTEITTSRAESAETLVTCFSSPSWSYRCSTTSLCELHLPTPTATGSSPAWENSS